MLFYADFGGQDVRNLLISLKKIGKRMVFVVFIDRGGWLVARCFVCNLILPEWSFRVK